MLRTPLCDRLDIDVPVICAPLGPWEQVDLAAAVCEAGGLGSLGTAVRSLADLERQWRRLRELTDRPFAINHTSRPLDEEAFTASLAARPAAISFHMAVPAAHIARAHDAGILWIQQVVDVEQAEQALEAGADVLVAQGAEAGGHAGMIGTMVVVPQIAALAGDTPVVAAGGIADGRGLAAALALGAAGVSMGTRFLASAEMSVAPAWKERIVAAGAEEAIVVDNEDILLPPYTLPSADLRLRSLRTLLTDRLRGRPEEVRADADAIRARLMAAVAAGGGEDSLPFAGQSVGLVDAVLPAAEIVGRVVSEAEAVIAGLSGVVADRPRSAV